MDRLTRKELKTDKFAQEVGHTLEYASEHRKQILRYGGAALAILIAGWGFWSYRSHQQAERFGVLASAIDAHIRPAEGGDAFEAERRKNVESVKRFQEVIDKYPNTREAWVALSYIASIRAEEGNTEEAEKAYLRVIESGEDSVAALARLSLGQLYANAGKVSEAEKILRPLIDKPSPFVSKEHATIALAQALAASKPDEARKLIEPLKSMKGAALSEAVVNLSAELK